MPIPSSIYDLSQTADINSPAGSESPGLIDNYLRTYASYIAQLRDFPGRLIGTRVFTSNGTYTPSTGTTSIVVECIGGGGGGGGANAAGAGQLSSGGGGGSGAYAKGRFTSGFSGLAITVGAAGAGGGVGGNGGATSLGGIIAAGGGIGGGAGIGFTPPGSGAAAGGGGIVTAGGNIITSSGFPAPAPIALSTGAIFNVAGAQSLFGPGPTGGFGNGTPGANRGTGGTGALAGPSSGPYSGGTGASGVMIIWEYS
ncbi:hypothetical protein [Pseudomonas sp. IT-347P]|uniref:glycine-rich domain-containing protein n=1 Tax=Pseudomonas sp. IT-347P TaxID=3026458 RepID=UPI0039E191E0